MFFSFESTKIYRNPTFLLQMFVLEQQLNGGKFNTPRGPSNSTWPGI